MTTPIADFTPHEAHMRLRRNSYREVVFTFSDTSFTDYTSPTMTLADDDGTDPFSFTGVATNSGTDGVLTFVFNSTVWLQLGGLSTTGIYQVKITRPDSEVEHLAKGDIQIEASL